jgi:hypothetical protein
LHFNPNKGRPARRPGEGYIMATTTIVPSSLATLTPAAHPTRTQVVEALTLAATREGSGGFAAAMLHRVANGQDLTPRMRDCVIDLTQREARRLNAATAAASAARLDAAGIRKMFDAARAHGAQRIAITSVFRSSPALVQLMKQLPQPQRGTVLLGVETSCKPMPVRVWAVAHTHMHACTERGACTCTQRAK